MFIPYFPKMWVVDWLLISWPPPLLPNITHIPFPIISVYFHLPPFLELNQFSKHSHRNSLVVQWLALGVFHSWGQFDPSLVGKLRSCKLWSNPPPKKKIIAPKRKPKQKTNTRLLWLCKCCLSLRILYIDYLYFL